MTYLRSGIFLAPFHALGENPTLALERDMELLQHLDKLNYHEAWIGEHHSGGFEIIGSPEVFIAAAAERTKHIRLGTGVISLPYHNPLMVANRIIQLDHMTRGRVMFGAGPGLLASDAVMLGIDPLVQRERMVEALDVILRLFAGETGCAWGTPTRHGVIGTPADAIAAAQDIYDTQGEFGCALTLPNNIADWPQTRRSFELYANHAIPHFRGSNAARIAVYDLVT